MDDNDELSAPSSLDALLEEIRFRRQKSQWDHSANRHLRHHQNTTYWTDLFVRYFLFAAPQDSVDSDDLLFFIRRNCGMSGTTAHSSSAASVAMRNEAFSLEVFRRDSRKLPIGDPDVDWEETVYLNLIAHHFNYRITLAVCARTSPKNLQVLQRFSQKVYATPSRRRMDQSKGETEEMTYPHLAFTVDNYENIFSEVVVRDGESIGVELVADDPSGAFSAVLFSASVPYEAVRRVYDARASLTVRKRLSQTNLFSLFSGKWAGDSRVEYVRLTGPQGHAELAISKVKTDTYANGGADTPCSEPGTDLLDFIDSDYEDETPVNEVYSSAAAPAAISAAQTLVGFRRGHQRRLSDPSSTLNDFMRLGVVDRPPGACSGLNGFVEGDATCEIYAGDLLDEFEETKYNPLWTMRGYTQIFHFWRESRRVQSIPLGQYVTYVSLPWWSIIKDVLDRRSQPLLTF